MSEEQPIDDLRKRWEAFCKRHNITDFTAKPTTFHPDVLYIEARVGQVMRPFEKNAEFIAALAQYGLQLYGELGESGIYITMYLIRKNE